MSTVLESLPTAELAAPAKPLWRRPDPRTLLLALLVLNGLALTGGTLTVALAIGLMTTIAVATLRRLRLLVGCASWIGGSAIVLAVIPHAGASTTMATVAMLAFWVLRFAVAISLAIYIMSVIRATELVAAFYRLRIPSPVVIPLSVVFRFLPIVRDELRAVRDAMALRGLDSPFGLVWHPFRTLEYVLVPLLTSCTRVADDLAASALLRGLGGGPRPTSITPSGFGVSDGLLIAVLLGLIVLNSSGIRVL